MNHSCSLCRGAMTQIPGARICMTCDRRRCNACQRAEPNGFARTCTHCGESYDRKPA